MKQTWKQNHVNKEETVNIASRQVQKLVGLDSLCVCVSRVNAKQIVVVKKSCLYLHNVPDVTQQSLNI